MASSARIFFAGIGTTFAILAVGFCGGLMIAKSAFHDQPMRANSEKVSSVRVVLRPSAESAMQTSEPTASTEPTPQVQPVQKAQAPEAQQVETADQRKSEKDLKAERRRYAERKVKRIVGARAQERTEPGIMAFSGDASRSSFFGN